MEERLQIAEAVRRACIDAAIHAYEDAGLSGLCHEGRWEYAVDALRGLDLHSLSQVLIRESAKYRDEPLSGTRLCATFSA
jgi:hypothetical protein